MYQIGRGLPPIIKQHTNRLTPVPLDSFPDEDDAKILYERTYTGSLTEEHTFGYDPLRENEIFYSQREVEFFNVSMRNAYIFEFSTLKMLFFIS